MSTSHPPTQQIVWDDNPPLCADSTSKLALQDTVDTYFETLGDTITTPAGKALLKDYLTYQACYPFASVENTILLLAQLDTPTQLGTRAGWEQSHHLPAGDTVRVLDSLIDRVCPVCNAPKHEHDGTTCSESPAKTWDIEVVKQIPATLTTGHNQSDTSSLSQPPYSRALTGPDEYKIALSNGFPTDFDSRRPPAVTEPATLDDICEYLVTGTPIEYTGASRNGWSADTPATFTRQDPYTLSPTIESVLADLPSPDMHFQDVVETICYVLLDTTIAPNDPPTLTTKKAALSAYALVSVFEQQAPTKITATHPTPRLTPWANRSPDDLKRYYTDIQQTIDNLLTTR